MPNPVEQLADAFKTEAMKGAWPQVSTLLAKQDINTNKYDKLFNKNSNITALSNEGNKLLVDLSQAICDAVVEEFTSKEREKEVMSQTQVIRIKSTIRTQLESAREKMEESGTKDMKLEQRLVMAGLQSFFEQLKNIDETAVLKAKNLIEKDQRIEKGKSAQPPSSLKPMQISQANDTLNSFAVNANKALAKPPVLKDLAQKAAAVLAKHGIKEEHLAGLFNNQELFKLKSKNGQMLRDLIAEALQAANQK